MYIVVFINARELSLAFFVNHDRMFVFICLYIYEFVHLYIYFLIPTYN